MPPASSASRPRRSRTVAALAVALPLLTGPALAQGGPATGRVERAERVERVAAHAEGHAGAGERRVEGRIEGRIRVGRALDARRPRFRIYSDAGVPAVAPRAAEESALQGVVVYLEGLPRGATVGGVSPTVSMAQRGERFSPRVLPVAAGSTVAFPNGDPVFHNVFSLSGARTFDLGRYPRGDTKSVRFDRPGVVQVFCHIHSDMRAVVLVLDTLAFAVPTADGRYAFSGVPPGEYTLVAWHERTEPIRRRVRVTSGGTVVENVDIPVLDDADGADRSGSASAKSRD